MQINVNYMTRALQSVPTEKCTRSEKEDGKVW